MSPTQARRCSWTAAGEPPLLGARRHARPECHASYDPFVHSMRRLFTMVAVILLSGVLPLAASVRLCPRRSCCRPHTKTATLTTNCCTPARCESPARSDEATSAKSASVQPQLFVAGVIAQHAVARTTTSDVPRRIDTGPPVRQRLAALSILLI